jgi:serine phosphatase RsbU (regulator of sigma subunit)
MAADGRDFGVERIRESFLRSQRQAPAAALDALLADAHSFTAVDGFDDDATVLMLEFHP